MSATIASSPDIVPNAQAIESAGGMSDRWVPVLLCVATALFVVLAIQPWAVGVFQDDGIYVILGKSLASGEGYRYLNIPGAPNATHYPPLYPALLALLWKVYPSFPENVVLFKFANAVLLGLAAALFYRLARQVTRLPVVGAAVAVLAFTACSMVVLVAVMALSEPLFLALLALTLLLAERAGASGRVRDAALAAVAAVVLSMCRTIGAVVIPAMVLVFLYRRHWRAAVVCAVVSFAGLLPWQLWVAAHAAEVPLVFLGKYGPYSTWLTDAIRSEGLVFLRDVVWLNMKNLWALGTLLLGLRLEASAWVTIPAVLLLSLLFFSGMVQLLRRAPVVALFMGAYLAVVVLWPFSPNRFLWAVWPVVGITLALGVDALWRAGLFVAQRVRGTPALVMHGLAYAPLVVAAAMTAGYGTYNVRFFREETSNGVQSLVSNRARHLAEWVLAHTAPSDVLAADDDLLIHLYTGRRTVPVGAFTPQEYVRPQPLPIAVEQLRDIVEQYKPNYVLASTITGVYSARGLVLATPPELRHIATLKVGGVFMPVAQQESR